MGTNDPDFLGLFSSYSISFSDKSFPSSEEGLPPIEPDNLRIRGGSRYFWGGAWGEED